MRYLLALILFLPISALAGADRVTSDTLRLADFFDLKPGESGFEPQPPTYDRGGPVLLVPDTNLWRVPLATPTPTPVPVDPRVEFAALPRLPMLIAKNPNPDQIDSSPFTSRGRLPGQIGRTNSRLRFITGGSDLRWSYELIWAGSPDDPANRTIRLLHSPDMTETFEIPAGEYLLRVSAWKPSAPQRAVSREWKAQRLKDELYEFAVTDRTEREFTRLIDRRQR